MQLALALLIAPPTAKSKRSEAKAPFVAFGILTFATIVLRLELGALLGAFALEQLVRGTVGLIPLVAVGIVTALASLGKSRLETAPASLQR